ncbi:MAG TPA: ABC transporter permease [Thermoanaerobaculia bacterium]|nr:ABC transporter permease [Thermoanaerobaculia bacterium]
MRLDKMLVLAKREYLVRVKTKGFWIALLALPLFLGAMFVIPALVMTTTRAELDLVVVDATGRGLGEAMAADVAGRGEDSPMADLRITVVPGEPDREAQTAALDRRLLDEEIDAWVLLAPEELEDGRAVYRGRNVSNTLTQRMIERAVSSAAREMRLADAGYDPDEVAALIEDVELATVRVTETGSRAEAGEAGFALAYGLFFLLYMVLLIWGQQVLQGVLEEKTSRVVEVIASAARPFDLMMGKLLGIGAAALTQFGVWMVTVAALTAPFVLQSMAFLPEDARLPEIGVGHVLWILLFFVLGFFVYSTMYAAVGAAFENLQDAQNMVFLPTFSIILPVFFMFPVINDSDSPLAVIVSLIPLLTPILMPLRIAVEMPPWWQLAAAALLTAGFVVLMVWLAARVYRVGILMYGKKPTLKELWRWMRYA